jgi:hypothetical protein
MIFNYFYTKYNQRLDSLLEDILTSIEDTSTERSFLYYVDNILQGDLDTHIIYSVPDLLKSYLDYLDEYYLSAKTDFLAINTTYEYIFAILLAKQNTQTLYTNSLLNLEDYFLVEKETLLEKAHKYIIDRAQYIEFDLKMH